MNRKLLAAAVIAAAGAAHSGCTVVPTPVGVVVAPAPGVVVAPAVAAQPAEDYVGNANPIVVEGVTYYPRFIVECDCILPVAFVGGAWVGWHGERIAYHGHWERPSAHALMEHRRFLHDNPRAFHPDFHPGFGRPVVAPGHHLAPGFRPMPYPRRPEPRGYPSHNPSVMPSHDRGPVPGPQHVMPTPVHPGPGVRPMPSPTPAPAPAPGPGWNHGSGGGRPTPAPAPAPTPGGVRPPAGPTPAPSPATPTPRSWPQPAPSAGPSARPSPAPASNARPQPSHGGGRHEERKQ